MFSKKYFSLLILISFSSLQIFAQYDAPLYTSYTTAAERLKLHNRLINYSINKNLSVPLADSTEENWEDAFSAIGVLLYKSPFTNEKIHSAFNLIEERSADFQKRLLELVYSNYPGTFALQAEKLMGITTDPNVFALCAEYLFQQKKDSTFINSITQLINKKFGDQGIIDPVLYMLQVHISETVSRGTFLSKKSLEKLFSKRFLPAQTVMYSIQRKNRDYPGILVVRNRDGNFITDSSGIIFHIPQLARSTTNLPFFLRNGNTPQGIFLMHGFGVSMSSFIGPTANIQLLMPVESGIKMFLGDSSISDTTWNIDYYKRLIPADLQNYLPLFYSYYAGLAGRTEIIAHGTTIDPGFYVNKPYYPLTPSQGCLCTKEIWDGKRTESDQQKLVNALLKAGGANGYCVVIELDDKQSAVTLKDVLPYLTAN
ncbi:MAG: hypothetical protein M3R50_09120 [Bacteroidota bacterium]|nr:hypothetical protein [Bacteroidota bacterium]